MYISDLLNTSPLHFECNISYFPRGAQSGAWGDHDAHGPRPAPPRKRAKKAQDKDDTRDAPHEKRHARGAPRRRTPVQHQRKVDVTLFLTLKSM